MWDTIDSVALAIFFWKKTSKLQDFFMLKHVTEIALVKKKVKKKIAKQKLKAIRDTFFQNFK